MVTPVLPHQNNVQQIGYITFHAELQEKERGRGGENPHLSVFVERFSREQVEGVWRVPTDREELRGGAGVEVVEKLLESARKMSLETLKGVREIDLSIDWTTKTWYGKPVKGLGSSEKGSSWNYATTKFNGKVLLLAYK